MVFDDEINVCEKCEHRLVRVKSYLTRIGACSWSTEYGCGIIDLKPIRKRIVPPSTDPKRSVRPSRTIPTISPVTDGVAPCRGRSACRSPAPLGGSWARFRSRNQGGGKPTLALPSHRPRRPGGALFQISQLPGTKTFGGARKPL